MTARSLRVKCATWEQVESFYLRKVRRGRTVTIRVPFVPHAGDAIAVGLELPNDLVVAIDGKVTKVTPQGDDRASIEIDLHGLTPDVVDRLETLVADGRIAAAPVRLAEEDPARELIALLDTELRRLRQLAVHEVLGVPWDASADEVRTAWRRLCQRFHPDAMAAHHSAAVSHLAEELMILVNRAYDRMRASLVAEGRASAIGPALRPDKGWMVAFEAIATGEVTPTPPASQIAVAEALEEGRRRRVTTTGSPSVRFERTTEHVFDGMDMPGSERTPTMASLDSARAATGDVFERQARGRLASGDHAAAREILAAALYVYPKSASLRALYHVASAMQALDAGQAEHASAQLEAALSVDPGCVEARRAQDDLRRRREGRAR